MKDLRPLTDYQREEQFPPFRIAGWIIRGAGYLGGLGFIWVVLWLAVSFALAVAWHV